jgi:hypothetical protein
MGVSCDFAGRVMEVSLQGVDLYSSVSDDLSLMVTTLARLLLIETNLSDPIPP